MAMPTPRSAISPCGGCHSECRACTQGCWRAFEGSPRCLRARPQEKWKSPGSSVLRSSLPVHLLIPLPLSTLTDSHLNPSSHPGHLLTHSLSTHTQPTLAHTHSQPGHLPLGSQGSAGSPARALIPPPERWSSQPQRKPPAIPRGTKHLRPSAALAEASGLSIGRRPGPAPSLWPPASREGCPGDHEAARSGLPVLFPRLPLCRAGPHAPASPGACRALLSD